MVDRPFLTYPEFESTLLIDEIAKIIDKCKEANIQIIHERRPNSCCYHFVCTFDSSRNKLKRL